jgi:sugar transferase (PEP-CTERM system associated)
MRIRILGHYFHLPLVGLALFEAVAIGLALVGAVALRHGYALIGVPGLTGSLTSRVLVFVAVNLLCFMSLGLYTSRQRIDALGVALRILIATCAALVAAAVVFQILPRSNVRIGTGVLAIAAALVVIATLIIRFVAAHAMNIESMKKRVLVYGSSAQMSAFTRMRRRSDREGFHLVGLVHHPGDAIDPLGEKVYEAPDGLPALCRALNVDELVVALQDRRQTLPIKDVLQCRFAGVGVLEFITFMERETGRIQLDLLNPSWIIFGDGFRRDGVRLFTARTLDIVASSALLLLASPVMLVTMLAIWLEDGRKGGGVFYRQDRVGFEGRCFPLTKFRSMHVDAEADGAQWASKDDARVTRVGGLLRRTRIDELPQLYNVLRGHMGFVGPRPERPEFVAMLEASIPYYSYRHSVKPGITGWAQVSFTYGSSIDDAKQKLQYDLYYIKNHNLLFDLSILIQTVEVVLMGKGAR